jgi:mRNA interferase MazF
VRRGDIYLVKKGDPRDPRAQRPFVVVSREALIDSAFPTVICAPIASKLYPGLVTQVEIGEPAGLKHESAILCDGLVSIPKSALTDYKGRLSEDELEDLDDALAVALALT